MKSPRFRAGGFLCPFVRGGFTRTRCAAHASRLPERICVRGSVRARCAVHALGGVPVCIRTRRVHTYPLRGPCVGVSCGHSCAASFRPLSPAALAACWKRGRSVWEISPLWKEFFLKFTSGNRDKPVQSSEMEPGVSARRGAASVTLFPYFSIDIALHARIFLFRLFHGRNYLAFYFQK